MKVQDPSHSLRGPRTMLVNAATYEAVSMLADSLATPYARNNA